MGCRLLGGDTCAAAARYSFSSLRSPQDPLNRAFRAMPTSRYGCTATRDAPSKSERQLQLLLATSYYYEKIRHLSGLFL